MSLEDALKIVEEDSKKIARTCRACGVKNTDVCRDSDCDTFPELIAQLVIVQGLKERKFLKEWI